MSLLSKRDYVGREPIPVRQPNKNPFSRLINLFLINQVKKQRTAYALISLYRDYVGPDSKSVRHKNNKTSSQFRRSNYEALISQLHLGAYVEIGRAHV